MQTVNSVSTGLLDFKRITFYIADENLPYFEEFQYFLDDVNYMDESGHTILSRYLQYARPIKLKIVEHIMA